jgi:hypothetical protein
MASRACVVVVEPDFLFFSPNLNPKAMLTEFNSDDGREKRVSLTHNAWFFIGHE